MNNFEILDAVKYLYLIVAKRGSWEDSSQCSSQINGNSFPQGKQLFWSSLQVFEQVPKKYVFHVTLVLNI